MFGSILTSSSVEATQSYMEDAGWARDQSLVYDVVVVKLTQTISGT